jgi:hypothetical protein
MFKIIADHLPRFMTCNGSRLLAASVPPAPDDTSARDEGTAAHYMAVAAYRGTPIDSLVDRKSPNGVYMTSEMAEHAGNYLEILRSHLSGNVELDTSHDYSPHWIVNGRADFVGFSAPTTMRVIDFKYGWRLIEPMNNWTLISHAIGALAQNPHHVDAIELCIFQPRPHHPDGHFRIWEISYPQLTQLHAMLNASLKEPSDQLVTSPHCHKCPALATCPAARAAEMNAIEAADMAVDDRMTDKELAFSLDNLNRAKKMLEDRLEALSELAKHRIKTGAVIDNYSAEMGLGNRRWKEGMTGEMLQAMTGQDMRAEPKLLSPAEAERRGIAKTIVNSLTERPPTGMKLVRISANKKATKLFGERKADAS